MTAPPAVSSQRDAQLAALLRLEQRARACGTEEELAFLMVNDTHGLATYRQAVIWRSQGDGRNGRIVALSGLAVPDPHAPFNLWLAALMTRHARGPLGRETGALGPDANDPAEQAMWAEHLPPHGWWLPLTLSKDSASAAALLLLRDAPWPVGRQPLLDLLADAYAHAWRALTPASRTARGLRQRWQALRRGSRRPRVLALAVTLLLGLLCLPIRQSVLAPAEVVARAPSMVRAPLQGVVDHIAVQPNQSVQPGQLLATLDARELEGRFETSRQALAVADAELRQGRQQALFDERSKSTLALLEGRREQAASDVGYLEKALARTQLHAERAGVAIFDDPSDWIGRPVALGERIMMVADPADVELEIQLPIADAIALDPGTVVRLFLNTAPSRPLPATLIRMGYRAGPAPDGTLAYRGRAAFDDAAAGGDTSPQRRVGLKGTAKLYGARTTLLFYLLRRPLATLRVWLGV